MTPRLMYVITLADMGGAQNHVLDLVAGFQGVYDIEVAVSNEGYLTEQLGKRGVTVHVMPALKRQISPIKDLQAIRAFRSLFRERKPAIVHAHSAKAGLVVRIAARIEGIRSVYSVHGWGFDKGVGFLRKLLVWPVEAIATYFTDQLVTPTEYDKRMARRKLGMSGNKITVIPYGIAGREDRAAPEADKQPPIVVMPARFSEQKDQETLIRAVATLPDQAFRVWLIGDGPNRDACQALVKELGLQETVSFLGTRHDLDTLLLQSQVFCLTTHYEGFPLTILEAMRIGLPVIATDVSGISEGITNGETGFLVGRRDVAGVARVLEPMIHDADLRGRIGRAGLARFERNYSSKVMLDRMDALYQSALR